ncbi:MAG: hypothetical protein Q9226_009259, partial [Calogaya cf. arnoldii]
IIFIIIPDPFRYLVQLAQLSRGTVTQGRGSPGLGQVSKIPEAVKIALKAKAFGSVHVRVLGVAIIIIVDGADVDPAITDKGSQAGIAKEAAETEYDLQVL